MKAPKSAYLGESPDRPDGPTIPALEAPARLSDTPALTGPRRPHCPHFNTICKQMRFQQQSLHISPPPHVDASLKVAQLQGIPKEPDALSLGSPKPRQKSGCSAGEAFWQLPRKMSACTMPYQTLLHQQKRKFDDARPQALASVSPHWTTTARPDLPHTHIRCNSKERVSESKYHAPRAIVLPTPLMEPPFLLGGVWEGIGNTLIFQRSSEDDSPTVRRDFCVVLEAPSGTHHEPPSRRSRKAPEASWGSLETERFSRRHQRPQQEPRLC